MKAIKTLALATVIAITTGCAALQPTEQFVGAKPGDNCRELYQEMVNQNLCNLALAEG